MYHCTLWCMYKLYRTLHVHVINVVPTCSVLPRSYSSLLLQSHRHREWVEQSYGTNVWDHTPTPAHTANSHAWF